MYQKTSPIHPTSSESDPYLSLFGVLVHQMESGGRHPRWVYFSFFFSRMIEFKVMGSRPPVSQ
jgi:hypothetical protein